jgi:hypothetical protein
MAFVPLEFGHFEFPQTHKSVGNLDMAENGTRKKWRREKGLMNYLLKLFHSLPGFVPIF